MRQRLYEIISISQREDTTSRAYDVFMMGVIIISLLPLMSKMEMPLDEPIARTAGLIFIVDYLLRWFTADLHLKKGKISFLLYPFTPMALIDLLSILPCILSINYGFRVLRVSRLIRALKVLRLIRYSSNINMLFNVFQNQKEPLQAVASLAFGYIFVTALIIFSFEPNTFNTFFDALYWATISLTTVGYGDIYAVTITGKIITMISSILGIAVVALPAGIITAGYMDELHRRHQEEKRTKSRKRTKAKRKSEVNDSASAPEL